MLVLQPSPEADVLSRAALQRAVLPGVVGPVEWVAFACIAAVNSILYIAVGMSKHGRCFISPLTLNYLWCIIYMCAAGRPP